MQRQMDIVYSSTTLLNIKRLSVVNGNACYEIEVKDKAWCKHKFVCIVKPPPSEARLLAEKEKR